MDTKLFLLLAWNITITGIIAGRAVYIIMTDKRYRGKFKRNLVYSDNVLNQHKQTCIDTAANYYAQVQRLQNNLDQMIKITNDFILKGGFMNHEEYQKHLDNKYNENRKMQEAKEIEDRKNRAKLEQYYKNKEVEAMADNDINMNVVDGNKSKKITKADYVGDFINENCPVCGSRLLGNRIGQKWCSLTSCDYGVITPEEIEKEKTPFIRSQLENNMKKLTSIGKKKEKKLSKNDFIEDNPPFIEDIATKDDSPTLITYDIPENNDINLMKPKITEDTIERYEQHKRVQTLGELFNNSGPKVVN